MAAQKAAEHFHMNSVFQKDDIKKVTRADWQATGPPYSLNRYAEIDAILANTRTRNMIKNVESNTELYLPSDHFPVEQRL